MERLLKIVTFILILSFPFITMGQAPGCPDVTAAGAGSVNCANPCTNLSATVFQTGQTTSYGVGSITYAPPFPYTGGTSLFVGQDDIWSPIVNLPFNFCFYGNTYNQIVVGANGLITFDLSQAGAYCDWSFTAPCPTPGPPPGGLYNNSIMGAYLDLDPSVSSGGDVNYSVTGAAPCRTFVVNFSNIAEFSCNNQLVTQQIVLYETTNVIEVYIQNLQSCAGWNNGNEVIGIQDATGANGISPPGRNTGPWSTTNEGWRFTPNGPPNWVFSWLDPLGNVITNNLNTTVCPTVNTTYTAQVVYTNCDGSTVTKTDPVTVTVSGNIPTVNAGNDTTICIGQSVTIGGSPTASGGAGGFAYNWTPAAGLNNASIANPIATPPAVGSYPYLVTVTDAGGCTSYDTIIVTAIVCCSSTITNTVVTNASCFGVCDGSITITATGATQYSVDNGANWSASNVFNNLCAGNYVVIAADATCADTVNITITEPPALSIPNTPTNPSCWNSNDGQIVLAPQGGTPPYSYQWNAAAGNQTTNPATGLPAGSFMVTVTDINGCFLDSTFTLTAPAGFTYATASGNSNCGAPDGWAAVLNFAGGTGPYTYDWGAGPTSNDTLFNLTPNSYSVTVADANGCDTTFTITVGNNASFSASITAFTDALCNGGNTGTATAAGSDPLATYSYSWNTVPVQVTNPAVNLPAGTYTVTVTDIATGCSDAVNVTIGEPPVLIVNAGLDVTICQGGNTNITAVGGGGTPVYTYSWDNGLGAGATHNVAPLVTTTYTVTITDANGCINTDAVTVTVGPPLLVNPGPNSSICPGDQANITANAVAGSGNGGPYTYTWDNGLGIGQTHIVSPAVTTTYTVTLSDGCTTPNVTTTVTVTVNPLPIVDFVADTLSLCETPEQPFTFFNLTDTTGGMVGSSLWNFGDGGSASGDTVSHTYASPGVYDITLTVTSTAAAGGCTDALTKFGYVKVNANPVADFSMNPNPTSMFDPTIHFTDESYVNIVSWYWNIGGLDTSIMQNPVYTFPEDTGHYLITLTVTDANGCVNTTTQEAIVTGEYGIYVPNAFTPDFDNLNDGFFPSGFGISDLSYGFYIFDRWGEMIFETHDKFEPWFGTFKNKLVPNGVYVWRLEFKDINGRDHTKVGHVTIVK